MDLSHNSIWRLIWSSVFCLCIRYAGTADQMTLNSIENTFNPSPPIFNQPFNITARYKIKANYYLKSIQLTALKDTMPLFRFSKKNVTDLGSKECSSKWELYINCTNSMILDSYTTVVFKTADANLSTVKYTWEFQAWNVSDEFDRSKNTVDFMIEPEEPPPDSASNKVLKEDGQSMPVSNPKETEQVVSSNVGAIVGGVIGVLVLVIVIIAIIYFVVRKQKVSLNNRNDGKN